MSKLDNIGYINLKNGEMLTKEIVDSIKNEENKNKCKELFCKLENNPYELTSKEIEEIVKIKNKKLSIIKEYDFFEEYYTGNKKKLTEAAENLSDSAYKCFNLLILKWTSCENTIQYKNNRNIVKDKDIADVLNISPRKWSNIKKELLGFNAIRKVTFENKQLYKINPLLIGHSMKITKCTYYAFRDYLSSEFDPLKTLYWDKKLTEEFGDDIISKTH